MKTARFSPVVPNAKLAFPAESATAPVRQTFTLAEAAAYVGVSESLLKRLFEKGEIPGRKLERRYVFLKSKLDKWLEGE